jgi:hypothetical protein
MSHQNFSQRTHPIHSIGTKTYVLGLFGLFSYCTKVDEKLVELVPLTPNSVNEVAPEFFTTNPPDPLHWTHKTHVSGSFGPFRYCTKVDAKLAELMP